MKLRVAVSFVVFMKAVHLGNKSQGFPRKHQSNNNDDCEEDEDVWLKVLARLIVLLTSVSAHLLTSPGMFFILIVVADGHLRRNVMFILSPSQNGLCFF